MIEQKQQKNTLNKNRTVTTVVFLHLKTKMMETKQLKARHNLKHIALDNTL